ncbi:hypothetical protein Q7V72_03345 [Streptococcus suis]|nr:hypothetical protein [Streptococcus suis]
MTKQELVDSYEELVSYTEEIRESLDILHGWLQKKPNPDDYMTYHDLLALHGPNFALLNLIMHRMDNLITEHRAIIKKTIQGEN